MFQETEEEFITVMQECLFNWSKENGVVLNEEQVSIWTAGYVAACEMMSKEIDKLMENKNG